MTVDILIRDHNFRQWLAARPGLWREVGVFDDVGQLVVLMAERRRLCLPPIAALRASRMPRPRSRGHPVPLGTSVTIGASGGRP